MRTLLSKLQGLRACTESKNAVFSPKFYSFLIPPYYRRPQEGTILGQDQNVFSLDYKNEAVNQRLKINVFSITIMKLQETTQCVP